MCVIISCASEYTLESVNQNIRDVYERRVTRCTVRTPNAEGRYPLESTS